MIKEDLKVGIVILNWNGYDHTVQCVESLKILDYPSYEIYIVDNNSSDDSYSKLKDRFPYANCIKNEANFGFAGGVNRGIEEALRKCSYIWLLNNDAHITSASALSELVRVCETDSSFGVVGSLIKGEDNEIQFSGGKITFPLLKGTHDEDKITSVRTTDYVTGCSMLIPANVLKKSGLIEESYFLYYEDADFCYHLKELGYKCGVVPTSVVTHELGGSSKKSPSLNYVYYNLRNRFLFAYKWLSFPKFVVFFGVTFLETALRLVRYLLLGRKESISFLLRAFSDGLKRRVGPYKKYAVKGRS